MSQNREALTPTVIDSLHFINTQLLLMDQWLNMSILKSIQKNLRELDAVKQKLTELNRTIPVVNSTLNTALERLREVHFVIEMSNLVYSTSMTLLAIRHIPERSVDSSDKELIAITLKDLVKHICTTKAAFLGFCMRYSESLSVQSLEHLYMRRRQFIKDFHQFGIQNATNLFTFGVMISFKQETLQIFDILE
jgi:hypothetical protein